MTSEFVNKLVSYYDQGCNCIGNTGTMSANPESGIPALSKPHQVNLNRHPVYDPESLKRMIPVKSKIINKLFIYFFLIKFWKNNKTIFI